MGNSLYLCCVLLSIQSVTSFVVLTLCLLQANTVYGALRGLEVCMMTLLKPAMAGFCCMHLQSSLPVSAALFLKKKKIKDRKAGGRLELYGFSLAYYYSL